MISLIRQHLEDTALLLASVEVAEDLDVLAQGTSSPHGTAFVVPYRERAKPNTRATGGHRQLVETQVAIAFLIRVHGDARGAKRAEAFDEFKGDIEQAMAGWEPHPDSKPFELVSGEGTPLPNNTSVYIQTWETTRYLTGA